VLARWLAGKGSRQEWLVLLLRSLLAPLAECKMRKLIKFAIDVFQEACYSNEREKASIADGKT
jgi:hypothetical protein